MIAEEQNADPGRNNPGDKEHDEIDAVQNFQAAAQRRQSRRAAKIFSAVPEVPSRAICSHAGRFLVAQRSRHVQLAAFLLAAIFRWRFWECCRAESVPRDPAEDPSPWEISCVTAAAIAERRAGSRFARFGDDYQFFRATAPIFQPERDDAAFANAFGAPGKFFDFVRIKIAAALDDDVLDAAGDENFVVGAIGTIARIHPRKFVVSCCARRKKFFGCRCGLLK